MGTVPALPYGRPLTRADLETMPDDGHRYELVDGVLLVSPSPRPVHQRAVARLLVALQANCPKELEVLPAPVDVVLDESTVIIPDVVIGRVEDFSEMNLPVAPVLAVEVLSKSTWRFDLTVKRARLESAGCLNYWIVDPNLDSPSLRCWALRAEGYVEVASATGEEFAEKPDPKTKTPGVPKFTFPGLAFA